MASFGERKSTSSLGKGYATDPIYEFAKEFRDITRNIVSESGLDMFDEPERTIKNENALETYRRFFVENSIDRNSVSEAEYDEHIDDMNNLFINDVEAIKEYASLSDKNPVIGMGFAVHKNILINCPFDKGAIQKAVAVSPKFTVDMETRLLITPDGTEIDMWKEQNKILEAMESTVPYTEVELNLPEMGDTDVLTLIGGGAKDNISIETYVNEVKIELATGGDKWIKVKGIQFVPGYGDYDRILAPKKIILPEEAKATVKEDILQGTMHKNRFTFTSARGNIKAIKLKARKDTSNGLVDTCSVGWKIRTDIVEIPEAIPINVTISPEEVKDTAALYQVNQLTKVMSLIKLAMENYKDDKIKRHLDESYATLEDDYKAHLEFDFAPREGYYSDHIRWREDTFMDALESMSTDMLQAYNDPNMVITVFGRPDLIRKIGPVEWKYQSPESIGAVPLEFQRTVVTNAERVYQFISSRKFNKQYAGPGHDEDELIVILNPRNTDRIMYRIYDYQMYVSNEIRNASNPTLPAVHAFERWKFFEYQPVQGRVKILNPSGLRA